mmetsp:Transcript_39639/g.80904  ORF Transcript_39639/g.80904 Transcript_39639/m.80904 type:complete len:204 (-) Transcript_39639:445-1056(-)
MPPPAANSAEVWREMGRRWGPTSRPEAFTFLLGITASLATPPGLALSISSISWLNRSSSDASVALPGRRARTHRTKRPTPRAVLACPRSDSEREPSHRRTEAWIESSSDRTSPTSPLTARTSAWVSSCLAPSSSCLAERPSMRSDSASRTAIMELPSVETASSKNRRVTGRSSFTASGRKLLMMTYPTQHAPAPTVICTTDAK